MEFLNSTGKHIIAAGGRASYDTEVINIIKDRQYLAYILQECTVEFTGMDVADIIPCICEPQVGMIPVEPGLSNTTIVGLPTESKIAGEGTLTYDIRFAAIKPEPEAGSKGQAIEVRLIIDIELQKDEDPGYDLVPRAILYAGRMLSEQMGQNVTGKNYDALQKVYSIWICMSTALKRANTISKYAVTHEALHGEFEDTSRSDLLQVIMVRLPDETLKGTPKNDPTHLMELLSTTFSEKIGMREKLSRVQQMGIRVTDELQERMSIMCNLSQGIYEHGIQQGIEQGIAQGIEQGIEQGVEKGFDKALDIFIRREQFPNETPDETAEAIGCSLEDVLAVINRRKRSWK